MKLAAAIRVLAGGSFHDIEEAYGIGSSTIYSNLWAVVDAINREESLQLPMMPALKAAAQGDTSLLDAMRAGFAKKSTVFAGCFGNLDGWLPEIRRTILPSLAG